MGISYNTSIVRDGLVLHLDAANPKSYPGSGTTWYDLSGNDISGTMTAGITYDNGNMTFSGSGTRVNFGTADLVTGAFSIEVWFKSNLSQSGTYASFVTKDNTNSFGTFAMTSDVSNNYVRFGYSGTSGQMEVSNVSYADLKSSTWVNYCGVWDGGNNMYLYRNGIIIAEKTDCVGSLNLANGYPILIGDRNATDGCFGGSITVSRIYNKALSEEEIKQNFNALKTRYGL